MLFRVSYPKRFFDRYPQLHDDVLLFYQTLFAVIQANGACLQVFTDIKKLPPPPSKAETGAITIGYHSRGRMAHTWHVKKAYRRGYFYVDRDGYSGWAEFAHSPALFDLAMQEDETAALAFVKQWRSEYFDRGLSKLNQPERHFQATRPYILLPLQMVDDEVMQLSRVNYFDFARAVAAVLAGSRYDLVIKRHPRCLSQKVFCLMSELSRQPHVKITNTAIGTLLQQASGVVCINGGVGFEALFYGLPVITAGASDYEWVTTPLRRLGQLNNLIDWVETPVDRRKIARYLKFFCCRYLIQASDSAALNQRLTQNNG